MMSINNDLIFVFIHAYFFIERICMCYTYSSRSSLLSSGQSYGIRL